MSDKEENVNEIPHPHPVFEPTVPDGYRVEWYERDGRRSVTDDERGRKCRGARHCPGQVVMALERSNGWWFYCDQHMYGSRLVDGKVLGWRVVPDPADGA